MKPFIILIVCLLAVVGLLGYINYKQDETIRRLQSIVEIEQPQVEQPRVEPRYIEIDVLGEIYRVRVDSEGRVKYSTVCSGE